MVSKTPDRLGDKPPDLSDDDLLNAYMEPAAPAKPKRVDTRKAIGLPDDDALIAQYLHPEAQPVAPAAPARPGILANAPDDGMLASAAKNVGTGVVKGVADAASLVEGANALAGYLLARGEQRLTGKPAADVLADREGAFKKAEADQIAGGGVGGFIARARQALDPLAYLPTNAGMQNRLLGASGEYVPESDLGRYAQTGIRTITSAAGPGAVGAAAPVPGIANALTKAAPVVGASGMVGQGAAEATGDPLLGIVGGAAVPMAASGLRAAGNKLLSVDPDKASLAAVARDKYGIGVTAGDMMEGRFGRYLADATKDLPFSGAAKSDAAQRTAFNRAVAKTFGESADSLAPEVMARARDRIGAQFEDVASRIAGMNAASLPNTLWGIVKRAESSVTDAELKPIVAQAMNITGMINKKTGILTGDQYMALTRSGTPLAAALASKNPNIKSVAYDLREALDDLVIASSPMGTAAALKTARGEWKNMRTVENLAAKADGGDISPALLRGAVNTANRGTYGAAYGGGGDLKQLADIGQMFLKAPPQSGTAPRNLVNNLLFGAMGTGGAVFFDPKLAALALAPHVVGPALGRGIGGTLRGDALTNALLARAGGNVPSPSELLGLGVPFALESTRLPAVQNR